MAPSTNAKILDEVNSTKSWFHAKKIRPIWAKQLDTDQSVLTIEGTESVKAGEFLCRGEAGDMWPQSAESLKAKYQETEEVDSDGWRMHIPRPDNQGVMAAQVSHPFEVQATWGMLTGKAGDYVVKNVADREIAHPTDVWIVDQALFLATYQALTTNPRAISQEAHHMTAPTAACILEQLAQKDAQVLNLLAQCRTKDYEFVWQEGPELHRRFARLLLKQGHPTLALEVAARGLERQKDDRDLHYCRALALVRSGNPTRAKLFVEDLLAHTDLAPALRSDALSLAGRIHKDFAARTAAGPARTAQYREARKYYLHAYQLSGDPFPGINAATLALICGVADESRRLAADVRDKVLDKLYEPGTDRDYWLLATLGEAYLLLGDGAAAKGRYDQAVRLAREVHSYGDIATMRRQLGMLSAFLSVDEMIGLFHLGPVIVFAGHGLDWPGDPVRFPPAPDLEKAVRRAIKIQLDALEPNIGYCIPGCGSDILFGELMKERDAELHIVLPFDEEDFCIERLTYGLPELQDWQRRYKELRGSLRLTGHFATTEAFLNDQGLYDFAGTFMQGLALTRAAHVDVEVIALVVQDPTSQLSAPSGLATFIDNWKKTGREPRVINLAEVRRGVDLTAPILTAPAEPRLLRKSQRTVHAMLFADVAGFSGLPEPHLPAFFMEFLRIVELQLKSTQKVLFQNTWGDGLYIVFDDVVTCAEFAMRLLHEMEHFDFVKFGFNLEAGKKSGVRVGLHTGPVFKGFDAVIQKENYFGSHVSRAARIEPVAAPGCAFVSEQFAAALALASDHHFICEYLGLQPLDKGYDTCPLYRLSAGTDHVAGS